MLLINYRNLPEQTGAKIANKMETSLHLEALTVF